MARYSIFVTDVHARSAGGILMTYIGTVESKKLATKIAIENDTPTTVSLVIKHRRSYVVGEDRLIKCTDV